jgi:ribosome-associated protein YbcJ (S4-like RNA binding protein)
MIEVSINTEFITVAQFLKHINLVSSGGEVKYFLAEYFFYINDKETSSRKTKIFPDDIINVAGEMYKVVYRED